MTRRTNDAIGNLVRYPAMDDPSRWDDQGEDDAFVAAEPVGHAAYRHQKDPAANLLSRTEFIQAWWTIRNRERRIDRNFLLAAFALMVMMGAFGCSVVALDAIRAAGIWSPL